jgi:hypothetical protein
MGVGVDGAVRVGVDMLVCHICVRMGVRFVSVADGTAAIFTHFFSLDNKFCA